MATIAAVSSGNLCRHGRAILLGRKLLSSAAAAVEASGSSQGRLGALRERLREEEDASASVKLHDFSFSGDVSYGTAVPRRTRDKTGKVRYDFDASCLRRRTRTNRTARSPRRINRRVHVPCSSTVLLCSPVARQHVGRCCYRRLCVAHEYPVPAYLAQQCCAIVYMYQVPGTPYDVAGVRKCANQQPATKSRHCC